MQPDEYQLMHALELKHWWFRGRRRLLVDLLAQASAGRGRPHILDFGCGTGGNTAAYSSIGSVYAMEPDQPAIRLAHARGGAHYCRANGIRLPFRTGVFDAVVASDVLEHIEDDAAAVREIARVLRGGGVALFTVPAHPWLFSDHDVALHHFRRYSKAGIQNLLERSGLRIRRLTYWNASLFPLVSLRRLLQRVRPARREVRSEMGDSTPWVINEALAGLLQLEAAILRRRSLPWGLSLIGLAEREG